MPPPPLSFTPPDRALPPPGEPVRRRQVFYLPGYDPDATRRYRSLFVREFTRYAKRFAIARKAVSPLVAAPDGLSQTWTVEVETPDWSTTTLYEVLLWDDLVNEDSRRPVVVSVVMLVRGMLHLAATGTLLRVYRLSPKFGNVMVYPFVASLLVAASAVAVAGLAAWLGRVAGLPSWAAGLAGIAAAAGAVGVVARHLDRVFFWQLLHDFNFHWQHARGRRGDYEARLARFAAQVADRVGAVRADEVMFIGHSTGAMTALEVAARALAADPSLGDPARPVARVTLGSALPFVAVQPEARRLRAEVADLVASERATWVDYQAPQDWMNFPGFNPVRDLRLARPARMLNPFVRSARYRDVMEPAAYEKIKMRPFRLHFQFLMANDRPGEYDFFALTLGPQRLLDRIWTPLVAPPNPSRSGGGPSP